MIERFNQQQRPRRAMRPAKPPTPAQQRLQRQHAVTLCSGAATTGALAIAERLAKSWTGCGCGQLTGKPAQPHPPALTVVEQAIADHDHAWLSICAPDQVDELADPQLELAERLDWWGGVE